MKKIIISLSIVSVCVAACSCAGFLSGLDNGEVPDGITIEEMNEKGYSIKLAYTGEYESDSGYLVYSRKGKKYRWDAVTRSTVSACYYDRASQTGRQYYESLGSEEQEGAEWEDYDYYRCQQTVNNLYAEWVQDCSQLLSKYGYSMTGKATVLNLPCDVWSGTYSKGDNAFGAVAYGMIAREGNSGEFYIWNGLALRTKVNGKTQTECTDIVVGIPDSVFTDTVDLSWIN